MAVLGTGTANGGCSLLHAAGLGYGASLALDLPVKVRLLDKPSKRELSDEDNLLTSVEKSWEKFGHALPTVEFYWSVNSKVPQRQGLKSSSAVAVAAILALCEATGNELENHQIVEIAADAQLSAGVSITGSYDDSWAALEGGWKLVDINAESAAQGVLLESSGPNSDEWNVMIICRGAREKRPVPDDFVPHQQAFAQSLNALQEGNDLVALTWNGRGVIGALNDPRGRRLTNDAFVNGARAAGISGSGTAIAIFSPSISKPTIERLRAWYQRFDDVEIIETKVVNS